MVFSSEDHMKLISAAFCLAAICAVGVGAQTGETKSKTKVKVDGGKEMTVSGCLTRNLDGGYKLTDPQGRMIYALVSGDDLEKHVGHRIEVRGNPTHARHAHVQIETPTYTSPTPKSTP